jgi:hypothetical protein
MNELKKMDSLTMFADINKSFWSGIGDKKHDELRGKILIEEQIAPMIIHVLGVFSVILCKAKGLRPVWALNRKNKKYYEIMKSYVPSAENIQLGVKIADHIRALWCSIMSFCRISNNKSILKLSYDDIKYGDIIYDVYLARNKAGTIRKKDWKLLLIIFQCIKRHLKIKRQIKSGKYKAVLVSHRIGLLSAVMLRVALRYGCEAYSTAGMNKATLYGSKNISEMVAYEYAPQQHDIVPLLSMQESEFDALFHKVLKEHISGELSMDALNAFSDKNKKYQDKTAFCSDQGLDKSKKNIFVMLHAFNDHPHSHFNWMIFNDYYDWFMKTLEYAKGDKSVNWIFKQHPSIKYYEIKDVNVKNMFNSVPYHIRYISEDRMIDTKSLVNIADAVITCVGSAGFELPAFGAIPAITAGDNHYAGFGFTISPRTEEEYYSALNRLKSVNKLTPEQQKIAKAVYLFIYYYSRVRMSAIPALSMEEHHRSGQDSWYWPKVIESYKNNRDIILAEIEEYVNDVKARGFIALRSKMK